MKFFYTYKLLYMDFALKKMFQNLLNLLLTNLLLHYANGLQLHLYYLHNNLILYVYDYLSYL